MATSNTTLKKGDNLPPRGRSNKTLILEMFREKAHLDLTDKSTKSDAEKAFFHNVAITAFNLEDQNRGMCLKLLCDKGWASVKPSSEHVSFDFDEDADVYKQSAQILKAISTGHIPPDIGNSLIQSISTMMNIEVNTLIKDRIDKIEKVLLGES